ncbi:MAG: macro domain-containing protein [Eubacterium sp.]|nr:macro domain-containing protein [Eubacterium sp.]
MSLKIVRNDITKMNTEAIVNTANEFPAVGDGCDTAIYKAAGYDELLDYRKKNVGYVAEGDVFITPGFNLSSKYIIHAVSPIYSEGDDEAEIKLRSCYRKSLQLAKEYEIKSIAFPLISTGSYGYPKEEGMRIAVDEINRFLLNDNMMVYLVVFDEKARSLGQRIYPNLEEYIDQNYVEEKRDEEYGSNIYSLSKDSKVSKKKKRKPLFGKRDSCEASRPDPYDGMALMGSQSVQSFRKDTFGDFEINEECADESAEDIFSDFDSKHEKKLEERMRHISDTFSQYLMYLIKDKNMENADVYKRAIVDKKTFSKIKNNVNYHPQKLTVLCLCVGARLNIDESKDLLARAGYALSPCDKTDIIFSYFIENEIYDMIELDIQLEEHGLPCIIT